MGCRASGYEVWVSQLQPHTRIDSPGIVRGLVIAVFCRVKTIVRTRVRVRSAQTSCSRFQRYDCWKCPKYSKYRYTQDSNPHPLTGDRTSLTHASRYIRIYAHFLVYDRKRSCRVNTDTKSIWGLQFPHLYPISRSFRSKTHKLY